MATLACDLCGGKLVMGAGGVAVCETCGMEHSAERMREKVQGVKETVRVDNSHTVTTYLEMSATALEAGNNEEAENYANKVIEIEPRSAKAWFYKGKAAGWQTTGANNRYPESIVDWVNAYNFASTVEKEQIAEAIKEEAMNLGLAIVQMKCNNFVNYRSEDNKDDVINALDMIETQLGTLKEKTEIDVYTDMFKGLLARPVNSGAVNASNNSDQEFGPLNRDRDEYSWRRYTAAQDCCLELLTKAYNLCDEDNLCETICENYIAIAQAVKDSCSYKWEYLEWDSDGHYVKEYEFTYSAKASREQIIGEWKERQKNHDADKRKADCKKAVDNYHSAIEKEGKKLAIEQYWKDHASEKIALENEIKQIEIEKSNLKEKYENNSDKKAMEKYFQDIIDTQAKMRSLGLFKGKEKKELAARIDDLTASKQTYEERWNVVKKQLDVEESKLDKRRSEISKELTKERGIAKLVPKQNLTVFTNGTGTVSALELVDYHKAILPNGFTVRDEGDDVVENYSRTMLNQTKAMMAALSALLGNENSLDDLDLNYEDNPETSKYYRINFMVKGTESHVSTTFEAKTIDTSIDDYMYYELEDDKSPAAVANFIQIVISSIIGICPHLELEGLVKKIAEAAYGIVPETTVEADGITCTITGGTKKNLKFTVKPMK